MALQNEIVKQKSKNTSLEKYGVEYPTQNAEISKKQFQNSNKLYILPSSKTIHIQGFEKFALNILINYYNENDILTDKSDMPKIIYENNKKHHLYFPDIYVKSKNLIIEVKSLYTYKKYIIKNILKALFTRKLGYNYEIWIFNKNGLLLYNI